MLSSHKGVGWILLILLLMVIVNSLVRFSKSFGSGLSDPMARHFSDIGEYSIKYPESWTANDLPNGNYGDIDIISIIKPFRTWPSLFIAERVFPTGNIDQVVRWGVERVHDNNGYFEETLEEFKLPEIQGMTGEYIWMSEPSIFGTTLVHCIDYYILHFENGYIFSFCSDQSQWIDSRVVFQEMINSLRFR